MSPLLPYINTGFVSLDAVCSWHRWALDFAHNSYDPIDAAYPILLPAMWSLIYKIQGTSDIWWTAQMTLAVIPTMTLAILLFLYHESKDKTFIFIAIFLYPYLLSGWGINGFMDMPVMVMGTLSLVVLYAADTKKETVDFKYYIYASLLLAGITSIIKQSGLVFLLFDFIYILIHIRLFKNKNILLTVSILSTLYFVSFLILYYLYSQYGAIDNISHLKKLSDRGISEDMYLSFMHLWQLFFSSNGEIPILSSLCNALELGNIPFIPYFIMFGFGLFIFNGVRKHSIISILSMVFFIVGMIVWAFYFSYDVRNSYWVKSFYILFIAININYIFEKYIHPKIYVILIITIMTASISGYAFLFKDTFSYNKQEKFQRTIGNEKISKFANFLLKDTPSCVKIYTNNQFLEFNYYTNKVTKNRLVIDRRHGLKALDDVEHDCQSGRYFFFRDITSKYPQWWKIETLIKDNKIYPISNKDLLYFVPAGIELADRYYKQTKISDIKLQAYKKDIAYHIDEYIDKQKECIIKAWAFIKNTQLDKTKKYILLKNTKNEYLIETKIKQRPDVTQHFKAKNLNQAGFTAHIYKKDFPKGEYNMSIILIDENSTQHRIILNKIISIE